NDLPGGMHYGIRAAYCWKQDNKRVTRFGAGIRYDHIYAHNMWVSSLRGGSDNYAIKKQEAISLQLDASRILPFTRSSSFYGLLGARLNVTLIGMLTGKHYYSTMTGFSRTEIYNQATDPLRRPVNGGLYAGLGKTIANKLSVEIQINGGISPIYNHKLSLGTQVAMHYSIGKPNTTERKIYTPD
ncbi:MAG: hypothetical protein ACRC3B_09685, partial [Bacteroidia bacterium]